MHVTVVGATDHHYSPIL